MKPLPPAAPNNRLALLACALAATLATAGCVPNTMGGYSAQCERPPGDGWQAGPGLSYVKDLPAGTFELRTRHLYYSTEPSALIEVAALVSKRLPDDTRSHPPTLFDPKTAYLLLDGKRIAADPSLRESPSTQPFWKHGGVSPMPANMNDGEPLVMTFPVHIRTGSAFVLHLGQFVVDGSPVAMPDLPYCYIPRETTWAPFHG